MDQMTFACRRAIRGYERLRWSRRLSHPLAFSGVVEISFACSVALNATTATANTYETKIFLFKYAAYPAIGDMAPIRMMVNGRTRLVLY